MTLQLTYPDGGMLVTGGTGNVGGGIVRQLARAGVPLVFTYRGSAAKAQALADELTAGGARVWTQAMDMSDGGSIQAALDRVVAECGGIHGLACGAGQPIDFGKLMDLPADAVERFLNIDALGYYRLFRAATPMLRARGGGTLTTCTTIATKRVVIFDGLSPLSKGSVDALIRQVAAEEAAHGIRANGVAIGWIEERSWDDIVAQTPAEHVENPETLPDYVTHIVHQMMDLVRTGRAGRPEDAGNLFAFLASNEASYITGQTIEMGGGVLL